METKTGALRVTVPARSCQNNTLSNIVSVFFVAAKRLLLSCGRTFAVMVETVKVRRLHLRSLPAHE